MVDSMFLNQFYIAKITMTRIRKFIDFAVLLFSIGILCGRFAVDYTVRQTSAILG